MSAKTKFDLNSSRVKTITFATTHKDFPGVDHKNLENVGSQSMLSSLQLSAYHDALREERRDSAGRERQDRKKTRSET